LVQGNRVDLAARAFTFVPDRVVTFADAMPGTWQPAMLITAAWSGWCQAARQNRA
jgi:hypothetical protein